MHLLRVDRYFRDASVVSELIFALNDSSRVLSVYIRIFHFFVPNATLESLLYAPGFQGYSNNLVPTDTHCRETRQHAFTFTIGEPGEELA